MPAQFSRLNVKRHHAIGVEIVAAALVAVGVREGITGGPVQQSGFRIVGPSEPGGRASGIERRAFPCLGTRLAALWQRPEAPCKLTGGRLVCGYESLEWSVAAGDAGDHKVAHHQRRSGGSIMSRRPR